MIGKILFFFSIIFSFQSFAFTKIPYRVTFNDPNNVLRPYKNGLLTNLDAAVADWSRFIKSAGEIWIEFKPSYISNGFGATPGGWVHSPWVAAPVNFKIFEASGTSKLITGISANAQVADVIIEVNPSAFRTNTWIDPHPERRTDPVPEGQVDLVTVLAHELGHGFGITGLMDMQTGNLPRISDEPVVEAISKFELLNKWANPTPGPMQQFLFTGPKAKAVYHGSEVPITVFLVPKGKDVTLTHAGRRFDTYLGAEENFFHVGRCNPNWDESDLSFYSVMTGCWKESGPNQGTRVRVNKLDAAILWDLGVPLAEN